MIKKNPKNDPNPNVKVITRGKEKPPIVEGQCDCACADVSVAKVITGRKESETSQD